MHFLVYLGFVLALCGISSAAPAAAAALLQDGHLGPRCSVTTIYVTVTEDPPLPEVKTFGVAHHLAQTQHVGAIPDELTTTITRTHTGFETVVITVDISGVSRSDAHIGESTSIRFLHDGPSPTEKEGNNVSATLTTRFKPLTGTGGPKVPVTVSTTSQNLAVPTGTDGSRAPLTANIGSQYLTAPTGTAATSDQVTVNTTSQSLTAPTETGVSMTPVTINTTAPTGTQSVSGDDGVVIETVTVYPVKSILPETGSNTVAVAPTPHDPVSASLFPTSNETAPAQTISILTNVTIPAPSPPQLTTLAAMKGFTNDQTKPLERKDALGAIPFVVATPNAPASEYMAPPADTHAPLVPPNVETTPTLRLPFITTVTFPVDISEATTYTSGRSFSTYIPGPGEAALRKPTPPPADSTTAPSTLLQATAIPSLPYKPTSCGEQGIFRLTFDDIPRLAGPANSNDIQPQPISSPYHHFYFSQGFIVSPPPKDPYAAKSAPLLLEFVTPSNLNPTRTHNSPPIDEYSATAEIGIGQNLQWGCYAFQALAASVGCDSLGPQCDWQFTGVQFNHETQEYKEVVTQFVSTASCPGLEDCKLADVVLLDDFMHLHALRVNVTAVGEPRNWWMDDLKLEWADGSCDAGLCRAMHR